jgi:UDP:flavonoid glycosyltransferase YjiC (YdhE family)
MSRFLFAWELGGGLGHTGHVVAVAQALRAAGHTSALALRDLRGLAAVEPGPDIPVWQAPVCLHRYDGLQEPPLNYAEMLMRFGYLDKDMLSGLIGGWRELIQATRADIVVADHAPSAILAARTLGLRCAALGNAFTVPPMISPTPNMRPWLELPQGRLAGSDQSVLDVVNQVLTAAGKPALTHLHELFAVDDIVITNFRELDHYGTQRPAADLARMTFGGPIGGNTGSAPGPAWPAAAAANGSERIFAYLKSDYLHLRATLDALAAYGRACVIYGLGAGGAQPHAPNLAFSSQPVDVTKAAKECAIGICHAGGTTAATLLQQGRPQLLLPMQLEQYLGGLRVAELGAGIVINPEDKQPDIAGALGRLLAEPQFMERAAEFAARYRDWSPARIVANAVARLVSAANGERITSAGLVK